MLSSLSSRRLWRSNKARTRHIDGQGISARLDLNTRLAGVQEQVTVTGQSPLVERTSNKIGGTLSRKEIEEVPSNFRSG